MGRQVIPELFEIKSLEELQDFLDEPSQEDAYHTAKQMWRDKHDLRSPTDGLPGDRIKVDGTSYEIVPFTHGAHPVSVDREVKEYLHDRLQERMNAGASLVAEQGLEEYPVLEDLDMRAMDDSDWAKAEYPDIVGDPPLHYKALSVARLPIAAADRVYRRLRSRRGRLSDGNDDDSRILGRNELGEVDAYKRLDNKMSSEKLPFHLEREYAWRISPFSAVMRQERSARMAEYLVHVPEGGDVVAVVGSDHFPDIVDVLTFYREGVFDANPALDVYHKNPTVTEADNPIPEAALAGASGIGATASIAQGNLAIGGALSGLSALFGREAANDYRRRQGPQYVTETVLNRDGYQAPRAHKTVHGME